MQQEYEYRQIWKGDKDLYIEFYLQWTARITLNKVNMRNIFSDHVLKTIRFTHLATVGLPKMSKLNNIKINAIK